MAMLTPTVHTINRLPTAHPRGRSALPPPRCARHASSYSTGPCPECMRLRKQRDAAYVQASVAARRLWEQRQAERG